MRVVMLASEVRPYAKTGGLADVIAALPRALASAGADVTVCIPGYRTALQTADHPPPSRTLHAPIGSRMERFDVCPVPDAGMRVVLLRADRYFDRDGLYGDGGDYGDNAERFAFFCRAALEWLRTEWPVPDVLHVHDWQAALAPAFLRANPELYPELGALRTVVTIHNLAYQGRFGFDQWHQLNLDPRFFVPDFLEFYGGINFLKAGLLFAEGLTTVSPRYAGEIQTTEFGEGLDGVLRARRDRLRGILNGVDYAVWNPATDPHIAAHFNAIDLDGKRRCKAALQAEVGLRVGDAPLLAIVSRLAEQKGFDLLTAALPDVLRASDATLLVLGSGEERYEHQLRVLARAFPRRVIVRIGFDEALAHRIEAGADVFLMPSRFEPCGLNQLYSLRYGTVPVVHAVGGLDDTVTELDPATQTGTGFKFVAYTVPALVDAVLRALATWRIPSTWRRLVLNGMTQDFSWERAAREYAECYRDLPPPDAVRL
jgi:starch synthase